MTADMMNLRALLQKSADTDLLREMIAFAAQRLMQLEVEGLTGAAHGERSAERINHRNGYRERDWETRAGTVELRIPKLRKGPHHHAGNDRPSERRSHRQPARRGSLNSPGQTAGNHERPRAPTPLPGTWIILSSPVRSKSQPHSRRVTL
jgi:hypothetical protein